MHGPGRLHQFKPKPLKPLRPLAGTHSPCFPAPFAALVLGLVGSSINRFVFVVVVGFVALSFATQVAVQLGEEAAEVNCAASFAWARFRSLGVQRKYNSSFNDRKHERMLGMRRVLHTYQKKR